MLRGINVSAAAIVLICFVLPWEQVSCGGASDTLTGVDLARRHIALWLIPLLSLAVLVAGLFRHRTEKPTVHRLVSVIAGAVMAYLMNDERARVNQAAGVISARLTGWFWLGFISSLVIAATAVGTLFKRTQQPE